MLSKLHDYLAIYKWRKISLILSLLLATIALIFLGLFIVSFFNYEAKEIEFVNGLNVKSTEQKTLFVILNSVNLLIYLAIILLSSISLFLISKNKNNGYIYLRITTYLSFVLIAILILLISIKPQASFKEFVAENGFVSIEYLPLPNYGLVWIVLMFTIIISLFSTLSRSNYGFLKNKVTSK